jgi:hypothetical protein
MKFRDMPETPAVLRSKTEVIRDIAKKALEGSGEDDEGRSLRRVPLNENHAAGNGRSFEIEFQSRRPMERQIEVEPKRGKKRAKFETVTEPKVKEYLVSVAVGHWQDANPVQAWPKTTAIINETGDLVDLYEGGYWGGKFKPETVPEAAGLLNHIMTRVQEDMPAAEGSIETPATITDDTLPTWHEAEALIVETALSQWY